MPTESHKAKDEKPEEKAEGGWLSSHRLALALGAIALVVVIAVVVLLVVQPWKSTGSKTPPKSGGLTQEYQTMVPAGSYPRRVSKSVKTKTTLFTENDSSGKAQPGTVAVDIDAVPDQGGAHTYTKVEIQFKPGEAKGSAPYSFNMNDGSSMNGNITAEGGAGQAQGGKRTVIVKMDGRVIFGGNTMPPWGNFSRQIASFGLD